MNPLPSSFIETRVVVRPSIVRQYASRCNSSKQTTISIFSSRNNEKDDPPRRTKDFLTPAIFCQFFFITRDAQEAAVIKNVPHHPPPTRPQKDHPLIWNANTSISSPGIHHGVTHLGPDDNHHRRKVLKRDTERAEKNPLFSFDCSQWETCAVGCTMHLCTRWRGDLLFTSYCHRLPGQKCSTCAAGDSGGSRRPPKKSPENPAPAKPIVRRRPNCCRWRFLQCVCCVLNLLAHGALDDTWLGSKIRTGSTKTRYRFMCYFFKVTRVRTSNW